MRSRALLLTAALCAAAGPLWAQTGSLTILAAHAICTGVNGQIVEFDENGDATCIPTPTGAVDGSGTAPQIAFWSDADTLTSDPKLYWSASNNLRIEGTGANNPCLVIDQDPVGSGGDWRLCSFPTSFSWLAPSGAGLVSASQDAPTLSLVISSLGGISPAGVSGAPALDEDTRWARNANDRHAFFAGEVVGAEISNNGIRLPDQRELRFFEAATNGTDFVSLKAAASLTASPSFTWAAQGNCSASANGGALTINASDQIVCSDDDGGAGGGGVTVEEADGLPSVSASVIQFNQADGLTVVDEGGGQVQINFSGVASAGELDFDDDGTAEVKPDAVEKVGFDYNDDGTVDIWVGPSTFCATVSKPCIGGAGNHVQLYANGTRYFFTGNSPTRLVMEQQLQLSTIRGSGDSDTGIGIPSGNVVNLTAGGFDAFNVIATTSSVNGLDLAAADAAATPTLSALGSDANISIAFAPKGTGRVNLGGISRLVPTDTPPTCTAALEGSSYADDSLNVECYCNGTSWVRKTDFTTGC